jgi:hypothetical protein
MSFLKRFTLPVLNLGRAHVVQIPVLMLMVLNGYSWKQKRPDNLPVVRPHH